MPVYKFEESQLEPAYGIECSRVMGRDGVASPFGAHTCKVPPGGESAPHSHLEGEVFFIARGEGRVTIGDEQPAAIKAGDVVFVPPQTGHLLVNTSDSEPLWFTSVWWDPRGQDFPDPPSSSLVMAAPPTPNGMLHLGHLSGPYLAMDAFSRIRRQQGVEVHVACGSDSHQTYVVTKGKERAEEPRQVADHFSEANQSTLRNMNIMVDQWLRPLHDESYQNKVLECLEQLRENGHVTLQPTDTPWCEACQRVLVEAHLSGDCPHCGEQTSGNGCEACFVPNICCDLVEPKCGSCGSNAILKSVDRLVFPLEPWLGRLREWTQAMNLPDWLRALADKLEECPTPVIPISHPGDWGIEVPELKQRLFAWWEMPIGFLELDKNGVWTNSNTEVVQAFGSDNAWYYLTLLPATLLALDENTNLPKAFLTNRFLNLDGEKFSTSRNHAVWGDEALAHLSSDLIRLGLASVRPESAETDFTLQGLKDLHVQRVEPWQRWWSSLDELGMSEYPKLPAWLPEHKEYHARLISLWKKALPHRQAQGFSLSKQFAVLDELYDLAASQDWTDEVGSSLRVFSVGLFARLAEPIIPTTAASLAQASGTRLVADDTCCLPTPGTSIGKMGELSLGSAEQIEGLIESRKVTA